MSETADDLQISADDVAHVARLARLTLTDNEVATFTPQLQSILAVGREMAALDLDGVPPTDHPYPLTNVTRPDELGANVDRDELLGEAPATEDGMFRVPPVMERER